MKTVTKISKFPKKFTIPAADFKRTLHSQLTTLGTLLSLEQCDTVTTSVKVISLRTTNYSYRQEKKQEIEVADITGVGKLTLWEKDVSPLEKQHSYHLVNFGVRDFMSKKYLVKTKNDSEIEKILDIGEVMLPGNDLQVLQSICNAKIIAEQKLDNHKTCFRCKARVESATPPFGRVYMQYASIA